MPKAPRQVRHKVRPSVSNPSRYLVAAEVLDSMEVGVGVGCCWALRRDPEASLSDRGHQIDEDDVRVAQYTDFFVSVLEPKPCVLTWWYLTPVDGAANDYQSVRHARVIGLILCAILAEEGFVP